MKILKTLFAAAAAVMMTGAAFAEKTARWIDEYDDSVGGWVLRFVYDEGTEGSPVAPSERISIKNDDAYPNWGPLMDDKTGEYRPADYKLVVFEPSFRAYRPKQCAKWFAEFSKLTEIRGLANLDTSSVTNMVAMFRGCSALTTLDLSGFNTEQVTRMTAMFKDCSSLKTIYATRGFDTSKVTLSSLMFHGCDSLEGVSGTAYSYANPHDKTYALLDFGAASTQPGYFTFPPVVILEDDGATMRLTGGSYTSPAGAQGTDWFLVSEAEAIDPENEDVPWHARSLSVTGVIIDPSFKSYRPSNCARWFSFCLGVQSIQGLENLDTSAVCNMSRLFVNCQSLTELDLSGFDTRRVESFKQMFMGCDSLRTIRAQELFTTSQAADTAAMFNGCTALVGGSGTVYSSGSVDGTRARIDGGTDSPGYFTFTSQGRRACAVLEDGGKRLRFTFDDAHRVGDKDTDWFLVSEAEAVPTQSDWGEEGTEGCWYACHATVTNVVFDASFKDYRPTRCAFWFTGFTKLTGIEGIANLDVSAVGDLSFVFDGCQSLTALDVSGFDTRNVQNMYNMFNACKSLTALDVSGFDTRNVQNMQNMFSSCKSLTALDVSGFDTRNVQKMTDMFSFCQSLTALDVSGFKTSNVQNMAGMFKECASLTEIDVSGFDTSKVTDFSCMFKECVVKHLDLSSFDTRRGRSFQEMFCRAPKLESISVSPQFVFTAIPAEEFSLWTNDMFFNCYALVGGNGTAWSADHIDGEYARVDTAAAPGYFSLKVTRALALVEEGGATLRFVYDDAYHAGEEGTDWFAVADAESFVPGYGTVPWADIAFDVTKVVFDPSFRDYRPTRCAEWFYDFYWLSLVDGLENLDTSAATDLSWMFAGCEHLATLDLVSFDTAQVTDMKGMFYSCSALQSIRAAETFVTTQVTSSENMFFGCDALVGGNGTAYSDAHEDATYARIDRKGTPGYFTKGAVQFAVVFYANGGTGTEWRLVDKGAAVGPLPTPSRGGYLFDGWFTSETGGTAVTAETVVTGNVQYWAHWTDETSVPDPEPRAGTTVWNVGPDATAYVQDGVLYVRGTGAVTSAPWTGVAGSIVRMKVASSITALPSDALAGMSGLQQVNYLALNVFNAASAGVVKSDGFTAIAVNPTTQTATLTVRIAGAESVDAPAGDWAPVGSADVAVPAEGPAGFFKVKLAE